MLSNEEICSRVEMAFSPYRCVAEIWDYGQKLRFRVFGSTDEDGTLRTLLAPLTLFWVSLLLAGCSQPDGPRVLFCNGSNGSGFGLEWRAYIDTRDFVRPIASAELFVGNNLINGVETRSSKEFTEQHKGLFRTNYTIKPDSLVFNGCRHGSGVCMLQYYVNRETYDFTLNLVSLTDIRGKCHMQVIPEKK